MPMLWSLSLLLVGLCFRLTLTELTLSPKATETKIGETTWLNCSTNLPAPIHWNHGDQLVYAGGSLLEPYLSRFEIELDVSEGIYNLVVPSVAITDAGEYRCQDDEGLGSVASAQLIVLANDPICRSNVRLDQIIGSNDCGIERDRIVLTCEVTYYGNNHPEMIWRNSRDNKVITDVINVEKSLNIIKYSLTVMAEDSFDNSSFTCETARSAGQQYRCTTEVIKILNKKDTCRKNSTVLVTSAQEEIVCSVNFNPSCSYTWFDEENFTISSDRILKPEKVGNYRCETTCIAKNISHNATIILSEVSSRQEENVVLVVLVVVVVVLVVVITVIVAICCIIQRRRILKKKKKDKAGIPLSEHLLKSEYACSPAGKATSINGESTENMKPDVLAQSEILLESEDPQTVRNASVNGESTEAMKPGVDETLWTSDPEMVLRITTNVGLTEEQYKGISGIAIVEDELYITMFQTSTISVYDLSTVAFRRQITVDDLVNAYDLAYCKTNNCLYIMDLTYSNHPKEIIRIDLNGKILRSWSTQLAYGCISVAFDSNIIFTSYNENKMVEYTSSGALVQAIQLSRAAGFEQPRHAMKLHDGHFILSFGADVGDQGLEGICVIDALANVKKAFGDERGSNNESLNVPIYLAIDSKGSVIVIDRDNSRVLLLDSDLKFKRELIPRGMAGMRRPERMAVDESTGRLFIAHNPVNWDSRLFVFKFG